MFKFITDARPLACPGRDRPAAHAAVFVFFRVDPLDTDSANISSGFSFRIFSPGIGTGYSPIRHPRQMSSRECLRAAIRPFIERYPRLSAEMKSAISGTVFSFAM